MRKRFFIVTGIAVAAIAAFLLVRDPKEPEFQGKTLSDWMQLYLENPPQATAAVRAFGTSAMPFVIDDLRARDTAFDVWWRRLAGRQKLFSWHSVPEKYRQRRAVLVCQDLGTNAQSALPYLEALLPKQSVELNVVAAIAKTGEAGAFLLLRAYTNSSYLPAVKAEIIGALQLTYMRPDPPDPNPSVTYLTNQIAAPVAAARRDAAEMLGWIRQLPEISVGALGRVIADPDVEVRRAAVDALGRFRRIEKVHAERFIQTALFDGDASVRLAATNALRDPKPRPSYE